MIEANSEIKLDLVAAIGELSRRYPNWRLGQLVANVVDWADSNVWDVEDEQLLSAVRAHLHQQDECEPQTSLRSK